MTPIDLANWPRSQHFSLFKDFSQPYFNVCIKLPIRELYNYCKAQQYSFFHGYIYTTLLACNAYAPMRQRIINNSPWQLDTIRASVVELADDDTFRFSYFNTCDNVQDFISHAKKASRDAKEQALFCDAFEATEGQPDLVHISVLPWLNFTSFSHAVTHGSSLAIPKIVFGQYDDKTGEIPISIDVHHALMDGLHVAQFIAALNKQITLFCNDSC